MERIKQALERARQERTVDVLGEGQTTRSSSAPSAKPLPPTPDSGIVYSQTRVVQLTPAVLRRNRIIEGINHDGVTTAYKMLRTQVLQRMGAHGWNALAVTSPTPGDGKTLTAINLALSLAREMTHTVLLVDLDLRHPKIHSYLGQRPEYGIGDFLIKDVPLQDILMNPGIERLVVLPGKDPIYNSSELLKSPKMVRLVNELKSRYPSRLLICDLPPLLAAADALGFAPYVDAVLLVVEDGRTKKEEIERSMQLLQGVELLGTVLNKSADKTGSSYY